MNSTIYKKCFAALLAVGATVSFLPFVGAVNEAPVPNQTGEQQHPITFCNVAERIINEDGSVTIAFHTVSNQHEQYTTEQIVNEDGSVTLDFHTIAHQPKENGIPRAASHWFESIAIPSTRPSSMNLTMDNVVFEDYAKIEIDGQCSESYATLHLELYKYVDNNPVRISTAMCTTGAEGDFRWSSSYGSDGEYGIKVWGKTSCTISGNFIY